MRRALLPLLLPPLLGGCVTGRRVITVAADGSGTVVDTVRLSAAYKRSIDTARFAEERRGAAVPLDAALRAAAARAGGGLHLVSFEEQGAEQRIVLAFADVRQVRLAPHPWWVTDGGSPPAQHDPLTFELREQGPTRVLTVRGPVPRRAVQGPEQWREGEWGFLAATAAGLDLQVRLAVDGVVERTAGAGPAEEREIVLGRLRFDLLAADPGSAARYRDAGGPSNLDFARAQGIAGLQVPAGDVVVTFRAGP